MAVNGKPRKIDYSDWSKTELVREIKKINKKKKFGLIWDEEKTREVFEEEVQKKLPVLKEVKSSQVKSSQVKRIF